jgi:hypothetical protein
MSKQTAVEWLEDNMYSLKIPAIHFVDLIDLVNQAKAMEKEQIMEAAERWRGTDFAERYYNETYGK